MNQEFEIVQMKWRYINLSSDLATEKKVSYGVPAVLYFLMIAILAGMYYFAAFVMYANPEKVVNAYYDAYFAGDFKTVSEHTSVFLAAQALPQYGNLSPATLVAERREIEKQLRVFAGIGVPPLRPVMVFTSSDGQGARSNLLFDWSSFFGSDKRSYPPPEIWNSQLVHQLRVTREWISQNRATRRIRLEGNRRLSASLALGSVFSAVAGFVVEMNFRGSYWATDQHPRLCEDDYPVVSEFSQGLGADLVVMGTVARTGIAGLFIGNTAEAILDQLACSVLAVKPSGFVTPVKLSE